jgi:hypothetical protein
MSDLATYRVTEDFIFGGTVQPPGAVLCLPQDVAARLLVAGLVEAVERPADLSDSAAN